jgi:cell division protein ZapA
MSNVTLHIGGRDYTVACAQGEEDHVAGLGRIIDEKIQAMGSGHNETRQLLFASLLLADELHEARHRGGTAGGEPDPDRYATAFEALAMRLEKCATALEG